MIIRALTSSNDWSFGKGISGYKTGEAAIEQEVRSRLMSWKGDCFFSTGDFVDWVARLDVGQQKNLMQELSSIILQSYGVVGINSSSYQINPLTRNMSILFNIQTIYSASFILTLEQNSGQLQAG